MKCFIGMLAFLFVAAQVHAELTAMEIDEIRAAYRLSQIQVVSDTLKASGSLKDWPSDMAPLMEVMENETSDSESFRWNICAEVYKHAKGISATSDKKRELVYLLTTRLSDRSSSIRGSVLQWLRDFNAHCFNKLAIRNVKAAFDTVMNRDAILLMGVLDPEYCMTETKHLIADLDFGKETFRRQWGKPPWAALLVHARYGDSNSVDRVLHAILHEPNEGILVKRLYKDLGYVRQPKTVEYLKTQIISDKHVAGGHDYPSISYAQEASSVLSNILKNFPRKSGGRFELYTTSEIANIKRWLQEQKKWEFNESDKATGGKGSPIRGKVNTKISPRVVF